MNNVGAEKVAARAIHERLKVSVIRRKSSISESGRNSLSLSLLVRGRKVQINPVAVLVKLWHPVIVIAANGLFRPDLVENDVNPSFQSP